VDIGNISKLHNHSVATSSSPLADWNEAAFPVNGFVALPK
jgi:hypothetical protein